jgi:hypothetical protein
MSKPGRTLHLLVVSRECRASKLENATAEARRMRTTGRAAYASVERFV